ncbi:MAG: hypothetical protein WKF75_18530 [Singulisphaera sp.]
MALPLTGNDPFPWQERLFGRMSRGDLPDSCDIPTGLGKTAILPIWLIALAGGNHIVPRRLVYVVNRRTVVDQATAEAEAIRARLVIPESDDAPPQIEAARRRLRLALQGMAADPASGPLAISTLRGGSPTTASGRPTRRDPRSSWGPWT